MLISPRACFLSLHESLSHKWTNRGVLETGRKQFCKMFFYTKRNFGSLPGCVRRCSLCSSPDSIYIIPDPKKCHNRRNVQYYRDFVIHRRHAAYFEKLHGSDHFKYSNNFSTVVSQQQQWCHNRSVMLKFGEIKWFHLKRISKNKLQQEQLIVHQHPTNTSVCMELWSNTCQRVWTSRQTPFVAFSKPKT